MASPSPELTGGTVSGAAQARVPEDPGRSELWEVRPAYRHRHRPTPGRSCLPSHAPPESLMLFGARKWDLSASLLTSALNQPPSCFYGGEMTDMCRRSTLEAKQTAPRPFLGEAAGCRGEHAGFDAKKPLVSALLQMSSGTLIC